MSSYFNYLITSITSSENNNGINVYPNPVSDELIIEIKGNTEVLGFEVFNSMGQQVFKGNMIEKTTIKTSDYASGIYYIKLENRNSVICKKFIKE